MTRTYFSKCRFFLAEVRPDPRKAEAIYAYKESTTKNEVQSFLGVINYYRGHIPKCAEIAAPLHDLTKNEIKFQWTEEHQESFNTLKKTVTECIIQNYPDWRKQFYVITDASNTAISGLNGIGSFLLIMKD